MMMLNDSNKNNFIYWSFAWATSALQHCRFCLYPMFAFSTLGNELGWAILYINIALSCVFLPALILPLKLTLFCLHVPARPGPSTTNFIAWRVIWHLFFPTTCRNQPRPFLHTLPLTCRNSHELSGFSIAIEGVLRLRTTSAFSDYVCTCFIFLGHETIPYGMHYNVVDNFLVQSPRKHCVRKVSG